MQDYNQLEQVSTKLLAAVVEGRKQIITLVKQARAEKCVMMAELVELKADILKVITQADRLEQDYKLARKHVLAVNGNFTKFTDQEIQIAYEEAQHLQNQLIKMHEGEVSNQQQQKELEANLLELNEKLNKAEKLEGQTDLALQLLGGEIQNTNAKLDELQLRQQLSVRIIKAQEEERLRVAREIHDGPAQSMANVVLRAEICEKLMVLEPEKVKEELHDLKAMVKESLQEVRKIIFNLRPMVLDDLGIVPTLRRFISELQKHAKLTIDLVVLGGEESRLPKTLEVAIFRIVQEALNNINKHAQAQRCIIKLEILPNRLNISVIDDGRGFDTQLFTTTNTESFGLIGMRERVELLRGEMEITSAPGSGTEIQIIIPIKR
ncbi:MAG TPA: histidine kinase [Oscillospiraceae bacterium]|nr:histidine kinase [Oscillospiraceae bacterium]